MMRKIRKRRQKLVYSLVSLSLCLGLTLILLGNGIPPDVGGGWGRVFGLKVTANEAGITLPPLQVYPLPPSLEQWTDQQNQGDYFSEIEQTLVGSLLWLKFPVKVYLDRPTQSDDNLPSQRLFQQWVERVEKAIAEWNQYIPLREVEQREAADIIIERKNPALGATFNRETGKIDIPPVRTAETRYQFYLSEDNPPFLRHRMTMQISPNLAPESILSATRHELGHALGIWGHSPIETDALYFSQVRIPPPISVRDINTLKKIYQQPTRLGGKIIVDIHPHPKA